MSDRLFDVDVIARSAVISPCSTYRYRLDRWWDNRPRLAFVMLNPSTADGDIDDPTVRRCVGFARRDGFGGITIVNLFSYRTPSPAALSQAVHDGVDPCGPLHREHFRAVLTEAATVVAAWGAHPMARTAGERHVLKGRAVCLGTTKDGEPRHPLYIPREAKFMRWPA